jgi:hypothetical protein
MPVKKHFKSGQRILDAVTSDYLNSLEDRLARLENLKTKAPVQVRNTSHGQVLSLASLIPEVEIVQLNAQLDASDESQTKNANILRWNTTSGPFEDPTIQYDTIEIVGKTSLDNTKGIIIKLALGTASKWLFVPWPLAQGDDVPGYDKTLQQALTHDANGWLRWLEIKKCPEASSSSSGS